MCPSSLAYHYGTHLLSRKLYGSRRGDVKGDNEKELLRHKISQNTDYDDVLCGIGSFKPTYLQSFANITAFVGSISIAGFLSSCLSVYIASQLTTLERMFGFGSATSGIILACNDIGYLTCILFASYFARRTHIPRVLYMVTLFYGISALVCCIPYFITRDKFSINNVLSLQPSSQNASRFPPKTTNLCPRNETAFDIAGGDACDEIGSDELSISSFGLTHYDSTLAVVLIATGMIMQGVTKAPRHPFISTYIDDNAKEKSPMYIGVIYGISIIGPAVAFSVGGLFSKIYVTLEATGMSYRDPRWIGAWWLGFLVFGIAAVLLATPLLFFPRHLLPKSRRLRLEESGDKHSLHLTDIKGLFKALARLFANRIYCPLVLSQICEHTAISGHVAFGAKYIETQFHVPVWKSNLIMGGCGVLTAASGAFIGGRIITRFKLSLTSCAKMIVAVYALFLLSHIPIFFLHCPQQNVKANWNSRDVNYGIMLNGTACLKDCVCDKLPFSPVCDVEMGATYYSACHAGCTSRNDTIYFDCSCIPSGEVLSGYCPSSCSLTPYIVALTMTSLSGSLTIMSFITIMMRCVPEADKPLALGLNSFLYNLFGSMPGPIIFGALIDTVCLIWNKECDRIGSCAAYDGDSFRYKFNGLIFGYRTLALVLLVIVLFNVLRTQSSRLNKTTEGKKNVMNEVSPVETDKDIQRDNASVALCSENEQRQTDSEMYEMDTLATPKLRDTLNDGILDENIT